MTRFAMVADLRRCVGCQTCTAACKHANATPPGVQWRRVLDVELGTYPDVQRAFVPTGCMHCDDPPCADVCPTTATKKRADGIVTIDYDLCIGCAYCIVACPYEARSRTPRPLFAYGKPTESEALRHDDARIAVATKCTFCVERIDAGLENGQTPGVDPEATPACVNSCIAQALAFGDLDDPQSNVSRLLADNEHFTMHAELGTGPGIHYLWDRKNGDDGGSAGRGTMTYGVSPTRQSVWDARAAANFAGGGAGAGLIVFTALASQRGMASALLVLAGLALIGAGLLCVWQELGRPVRALNVFFHPRTSWMTREALVATLLFPAGVLAAAGVAGFVWIAAALALAFVVCQARMLQAARGIPAWREPLVAPLLVVTALVEGAGLWLGAAAWLGAGAQALLTLFGALVLVRIVVWLLYRRAIATAAPQAHAALDTTDRVLQYAGTVVPLASVAVIAAGFTSGGMALGVAAIAGIVAAASGTQLKVALVTQAGFTQGAALARLPVRGTPRRASER